MNQHNPIAVRIDEMVNVWRKNVQPHHTLIRWLLKPEDNRMYEGFCRLESSQHGKLDNLFVFFYTPFANAETYSYELIRNWLREFDDPKSQQILQQVAVNGSWDLQPYRQAVANENYEACHALLPDMIKTYREFIGQPQVPFVFSILPKQMSGPRQFEEWLTIWMMQQKPEQVQLLVYDHVDSNHYGDLFDRYNEVSVTLQHDLRMKDAIRQIATAGAATDPYAFFRKCMFEMGDASSRKNKEGLLSWGEKAIEAAKKTGDKSLLATAYITIAGMLFNFKDHDRINELLDTGIRLCKQQIASGDQNMKPMLLQFYTYKGADCQIQKERKEALEWFMKAGDAAREYELPSQAISAYYKAYIFANFKKWHDEKLEACEKALQLTDKVTDDEIQVSEYPFMAYEYVQSKPNGTLVQPVSEKMVRAFGDDWQKTVEDLKQNYTKQKLRQLEAGEIPITSNEPV